MKLVISEKPSVAQSIADVIGAKQRGDGYLEGGGYLVSWCLGHLAELASAESYDARYGKWNREDLPILPESWRFTVGKDKWKQFDILRTLMRRDDVSEIINACDAGREGELIFRTVYCMAGCEKPMKRLWISSMEDEAIRKGFAELKPGRDYDGLHQSALCRSKADWLVGINATRLFSVLYHRTLNVGRVMSPTLALIVQREAEISAFQPEPFYTVNLDCGDFTTTSDKLKAKPEADAFAAACKGKAATVKSEERKKKSEKPPALYDLTTLQRDANRLLGYTAQQTLDYLQSLYEKKLCTYPRTDSRFLTNDMEGTVPALATVAAAICGADAPESLNAGQVCDSAKVSDHHAVVPTSGSGKADISAMPAGEREILRLVSHQLLCAVGNPHQYAETAVTLACAGYDFTVKGKTVLIPGWKTYLQEQVDILQEINDVRERDIQQYLRENHMSMGGHRDTAPETQTVPDPPQEADIMPDAPELALDEYPMPDSELTVADLEACGYLDGDLLPLSKDRALELLEQDLTIYMIEDGCAGMAFDADEIQANSGLFAVSREEWEQTPAFEQAVKDRLNRQEKREAAFLNISQDAFAIYQVKGGNELRDIRFEPLSWLESKGIAVDHGNYDLAYTAPLTDQGSTDDRLGVLWDRFNNDHPADYHRPSLSVSDIVALKQNGAVSCHYVDSFGFQELPVFLKPENYLKNAEMAMEDDYGMVDGIINNGPKATVAELEQQAKAGQPISLLELAQAQRRENDEKKKSVVEQLKSQPVNREHKKTAPDRSAEMER